MKKLLTIPGGPDPFIVDAAKMPAELQSLTVVTCIPEGVCFWVPSGWLSDIPKKKVRYYKPLDELLKAMLYKQGASFCNTSIEWAFRNAGQRVKPAEFIDQYVEEREEDECI